MTRWVCAILAVLAAPACAIAKPKPAPPPAPAPAAPKDVDGNDAARVYEAKAAAEAARLRYFQAVRDFERKYGVDLARGEGWDEVGPDGKPCADPLACFLRVRQAPPEKPAPVPAPRR